MNINTANKMKKVTAFLNNNKGCAVMALSLVLMIFLSSAFSSIRVFAEECEDLRGEVLRLHILANSNSERDQRLKLLVRDEILRTNEEIFPTLVASKAHAADSITDGKAKAVADAKEAIPLIKAKAEAVLKQNGCTDNVEISLENIYFTTREYDRFTLPAGYYDALRVTIGSAKGKNWWCVLYPPLCLPAASETEALDILGDEKADLIEGKEKYQFKFAAVELYEKLKSIFSK